MKIKPVLALLLILSLAVTAGCGKTEKGEANGEQQITEGSITLCMRTPDTLNPILTAQTTSSRIYDLIYDSLVYVDRELRPVSALAEKCSISDDGKTIKFTLREGILWHDGKAFTAYDVEHTFRHIINSEDSVYKDRLLNVESISVTDITHFDITLSQPNVNILNLLDFPIIPVHNPDPENNPIGTGMYKYVKMATHDNITLERNENWTLGEKPYFKTIHVKLVDTEEDIFALVNLGDVSAAVTDISNVGSFGADGNIEVISAPTLKYEFLGLNYENSALSSYLVRQAISYAINRDEISDNVYFGHADPANAPVPASSWLYDEDYNRFGYDTDKARQCLLDDGYTDGGGVYQKTVGEEDFISLDFAVLVNDDNAFRIKSGELICEQLSEAGIQATLVKLPFEEYIKRIQNGEYSMFLGGYDLSADLDFRFMLSSAAIGAGTNVFNYSSIDMDRATQALCTPTTDEGIKEAYSYFQMIFSRDVPVVGIGFVNDVFTHSDRLDIGEEFASYKIYREIGGWKIKN